MVKKSWIDRAIAAFHTKDEEEFKEALKEGETKDGDEATHIHVHGSEGGGDFVTRDEMASHVEQNAAEHQSFRDDLEALKTQMAGKTTDSNEEKKDEEKKTEDEEGELEEEAPVGTGDRARKATDSAYLADSYRDTISMAEILSPGIKVPTFDHKAPPKTSFKAICGLRRQALDAAYAQADGRSLIEQVMAGKPLNTKNMSCDAVRTVFRAVAAMKKKANNDSSQGHGSLNLGQEIRSATIQSVSDINKAWETQNAKKFNN